LNTLREKFSNMRLCLFLVLTFILEACTSGGGYVNHAFGFDTRYESPDIYILDYYYGKSGLPGTSAETGLRQFGVAPQVAGIHGPQPVGDTLYVKWRIKSTGQEFSDRVNLLPLVPPNMTDKQIYFVARADQLYIYLWDFMVTRPPQTPIVGPFLVQPYLTKQIYPVANSNGAN
jgi:hypothetical protein